MAEFHQKVPLPDHNSDSTVDVGDLMFAIYQAITNTSQNVLQFAVHNNNTAVWIDPDGGGTAEAFGTPTSGLAFLAGNGTPYMVIEPVATYPGGGKWQLKLSRTGAGINYELDQAGTWSSATGNFSGSVATTGTLSLTLGGVGVTNVAETHLYFSSGTETYNVSDSYSYMRLLLRNNSANSDWGLYCGGYIPFSPSVDTKPIVVIAGTPATSGGWTSTSSSISKTHQNYAHTAAPTTGAYVTTITAVTGGTGHDYSSNYIAPSAYLCTQSGETLGIFGPTTFRGFDATVPDWTVDASGAYVKAGGWLHRFVG